MIKTYTAEELKEVLAQHELWLRGIGGTRANLTRANLSGANLTDANLRGANLTGADLSNANLTGAKLPHFQIVPPCGSFLGYKKVIGDKVLTLEIPADARRTSSLVGRKCRCDKATVLSAVDLLSGKEASPASWYSSLFYPSFLYKIGGTVEEPTYDDDIRVECTRGIHFYITPEEAKSN